MLCSRRVEKKPRTVFGTTPPTSHPPRRNHLSCKVAQTQNQSDKIRIEHANEVLDYEGAFDSSEMSTTPSDFDHSFVPASQKTEQH